MTAIIPQAIQRTAYQPPAFLIDRIDLKVGSL